MTEQKETRKEVNLMKLSVEISNSEFKYSYEVGEERHFASKKISTNSVCLFVDLLRSCHKHWESEQSQAFEKSWAKALAEFSALNEKVKP